VPGMDVEAGTREPTRFRGVREGVEVIEVEYDEVIWCTTMQPVREPGPKVVA
jgi:hypothetical protein